jgi:hypothetical protein
MHLPVIKVVANVAFDSLVEIKSERGSEEEYKKYHKSFKHLSTAALLKLISFLRLRPS